MNDRLYKRLVEELPIGYAHHKSIYSNDGVPCDYEFIKVNTEFEKLTGLKRDDIVGKRISEIMPEILKSEFDWIVFYGNLAATYGKTEFIQFSEPLKRWYKVKVYSTEKHYFTTMFTDISTEMNRLENQKKIEEELRYSLEKFRIYTEKAPLAVFVTDNAGYYVDVNLAACTITGYTREELLNLSIPEFLAPESLESGLNKFKEVKSKGISEGEVLVCKKDGTRFWIHIATARINDERIIAFCTDITEQKNALINIEYGNIFQKLVADISSDFVKANSTNIDAKINKMLGQIGDFFEVDKTYLYLFSSDTKTMTCTHEWFAKDNSAQKEAAKEYRMDDYPWWKKQIINNMSICIPDVSLMTPTALPEKGVLQKQGIQSTLAVPIADDKKVIGFIGFDVVKQKVKWQDHHVHNLKLLANILADAQLKVAAEKKIIIAKEKAEAANAAKSQFLANMSHEIRTPMNAVLGMTELLEESIEDVEIRKYIHILKKNGDNLLRLINDILDISKIEAGKIELQVQQTSVFKLIEELASMYQTSANKKGLSLRMDKVIYDQKDLTVWIDENRLRQVMINLIGNAIKFTDQGEVIIRFKITDDDQLQFSVQDTGIGIPKEKIQTIFTAFNQVDSSTTRSYEGTGLGLAISKQIVDAMVGRIWAESEVGFGSTFVFEVPYQSSEQIAPIVNKEQDGPSLGDQRLHDQKLHEEEIEQSTKEVYQNRNMSVRPKILLVEDREDNRLLIEAYLRNSNIHIDIAANGQEAVDAFMKSKSKMKESSYTLVLMDIQMPVMDGYEATRRIRTWEKENRMDPIPIYALTAYALVEERFKSLKAGCNEHVTKPVKKRELLELIAKHL